MLSLVSLLYFLSWYIIWWHQICISSLTSFLSFRLKTHLPDGHLFFSVSQVTLGMPPCTTPDAPCTGLTPLNVSLSVRGLVAACSRKPNSKGLKQLGNVLTHIRWSVELLGGLIQWLNEFIQGPGFSVSSLYSSPRTALSPDSWSLPVAIRTTCFLVHIRRAFLSQNSWRKILSYGLNGSTYDLYTNRAKGNVMCSPAYWSRHWQGFGLS